MRLFWLLMFLLFIKGNNSEREGIRRESRAECNLSDDIKNDIASYRPTVERILSYFQNEFKGQTYERISRFVDKFGTRLTGAESLELSIDEMKRLSINEGLEDVQDEQMQVDHWIRGNERCTLIKPRIKNFPMLGLGNSVNTPEGGIRAKVVVVQSFEELDGLTDDQIRGKIVVYDQPWTTYGRTVVYRNRGASEASKRGAVAALVRSVAPFSIATPHTGVQEYDPDVTKIPVAAITHEDADFLRREQNRGHEIEIELVMSARVEKKISRNLRADLKGREMADRVVIISGHIDSWDVGDGSMDDTGGFYISWLAPVVLKKMDLKPRRTLRSVMFTAEEQGLFGAIEYEKRLRNTADKLVFLMESDSGTFAPLGLNYDGDEMGECMMREILKMFTSINATELVLLSPPAPDISIWTDLGYPGVGLHNANQKYFWFHHTEGDALNVLDSNVMDLNGGFWTSVGYIMADMKYEIPINGGITIKSSITPVVILILSKFVLC